MPLRFICSYSRLGSALLLNPFCVFAVTPLFQQFSIRTVIMSHSFPVECLEMMSRRWPKGQWVVVLSPIIVLNLLVIQMPKLLSCKITLPQMWMWAVSPPDQDRGMYRLEPVKNVVNNCIAWATCGDRWEIKRHAICGWSVLQVRTWDQCKMHALNLLQTTQTSQKWSNGS